VLALTKSKWKGSHWSPHLAVEMSLLSCLQILLRANTTGTFLKPNGDGAVNADSDTPDGGIWVVDVEDKYFSVSP
jgi:hypothetical protein